MHAFTPKCSLPHGSVYILSKYSFGTCYLVSGRREGEETRGNTNKRPIIEGIPRPTGLDRSSRDVCSLFLGSKTTTLVFSTHCYRSGCFRRLKRCSQQPCRPVLNQSHQTGRTFSCSRRSSETAWRRHHNSRFRLRRIDK
jgi:hypothetical protein